MRVARGVLVAVTALYAIAITVISIVATLDAGTENLWPMSWVGFLVVGGFLVARRPENRVGWTLAGMGLLAPAAGISEAASGLVDGPGGVFLAMLSSLAVAGFVLVPLLFLWYPTGQVPSPRWLWLQWTSVALGALVLLYYATRPGRLSVTRFDNPLGLSFLAPLRDSSLEQGLGFAVGVCAVLSFVSLVMRWRRQQGQERRQIKVVAFVVCVIVGWFVLALGLESSLGEASLFVNSMQVLGFVLGLNAIAAAIAVSIVRYRLYEIDRIVSRTVTYAVIVVVLGGVYVVGITGLTTLLPDQSQLVVAAVTLAVATLFNPLRKRVQGWVDRRFNRSHYDTQRVMDGFAGSLRDQIDAVEVVDGWVGVVTETMQPTSVSVWVREDNP